MFPPVWVAVAAHLINIQIGRIEWLAQHGVGGGMGGGLLIPQLFSQ